MAATHVHAIKCLSGAQAKVVIRFAGLIVAASTCKNLPGVFQTNLTPMDENDSAQIYFAQLREHDTCGEADICSAGCRINIGDNLLEALEALDTIRGEQKRICEDNGGSYGNKLFGGGSF